MSRKKYDNDLVLHQIFGQDTKSSNEALKGLLEAILDLNIDSVKVKNSNVPVERLKEKNVCLVVIVTLEDGTNDLVDIGVESHKEYGEAINLEDLGLLIDAEKVNRKWIVTFLNHNRYVGEDIVKIFQWENEKGEIIEELDSIHMVTVEPEKLKKVSFEQMNAKERYIYYLTHITKEDELLKKIIEYDHNVQVLNNRLMEVYGWQNKMHC